jgi:M6 family metalloprotease-like protein
MDNGPRIHGALIGVLMSALCAAPSAGESDLPAFGYRGLNAPANVPLLVITAQYGSVSLASANPYYENLIFGAPPPPARTVSGYFEENSKGRFRWSRAGPGIIGPLLLPTAIGQQTDNAKRAAAIVGAAMGSGFDFAPFDTNGDGKVTADELAMLLIESLPSGQHLGTDPSCIKTGGSRVEVCETVLLVGDQPPLSLVAHELSHFLGTRDLYFAGQLNSGCTLMGPPLPGDGANGRQSAHLDPWHKLELGWLEPRIRSLKAPGSETLVAAHLGAADSAVILFDPARGPSEYFIVEYRSPDQSSFSYDQNVCGEGVAIWHVAPESCPGQTSVLLMSEPRLDRGGNTLWKRGEITPTLRWADGSSAGIRIAVRPGLPGARDITFEWAPPGPDESRPAAAFGDWHSLGGNVRQPVAIKNQDGRIEVFAVGADGALWHLWQTAPNGPFAAWHSLGGNVREPIAIRNQDGRIELFAVGADRALWHLWQTAPNGPFDQWHSLGGDVREPVAIQNQDGRIEIFAVGANDALWHLWQRAPNGPFDAWHSLGGNVREPVAVRNQDGRIELLAVGADQALWHLRQTAPNGPFDAWSSLGGNVRQPVAIQNQDGRNEVFARGADGALWRLGQTSPNGPFTGWDSLCGTVTRAVPIVSRGGRIELYAIGTDAALWQLWQLAPNGPFAEWHSLAGNVRQPFVIDNQDGRMEVFVIGADGALWHRWQTAPQ